MAIYHLSAKIVRRGELLKKLAYFLGKKIGNVSTSRRRDKDSVYSEVVLPDGSNSELPGFIELCGSVDENRKRKNTQVAVHVIVALPRELTFESHKLLLVEFCKAVSEEGHPVLFVIHQENPGNPHAHLMRPGPPFDKKMLKRLRKTWEEFCNSYLDKYAPGTPHISCMSYKSRGIAKLPTKHIGPKEWYKGKEEIDDTDDFDNNLDGSRLVYSSI